MAGNTPIWQNEDPRYNRPGFEFPGYLGKADAARLERIRQARMLFDGQHRELFLDEGRTQFSFRQVRTNDGTVKTLYVTNNVLKLVAIKAADLLFGETPLINSDDAGMDAAISELMERCGLHQVLYQAAIDASVEADAFLEAILYDQEVYLQQVPGHEMFPQGKLQPDGQFKSYIRRSRQCVGTGDDAKELLLESTYTAGAIERHCFDVAKGGKVEVPLATWPEFKEATPPPVQPTGIEWNTITWIPNIMIRKQAVSDFDGVVELQDALNAKSSQLAVVILKHSQPKLLVPEQSFDDQGKLKDAEVLVKRENETAEYLTWDAQLAAAQEDRKFVLTQLLVQTETSPVLLGLKGDGAAPDAYRKVKLEAFNSLTKAARRAVYWAEGVRTAVTAALMLAATVPGGSYTESTISVQLRDGIPNDQLDEANRLSILKSSDIVDDQWCLEQLLSDPTEVEEILARKKEKAAAATPTIFMGNETGLPTEDPAAATVPVPVPQPAAEPAPQEAA